MDLIGKPAQPAIAAPSGSVPCPTAFGELSLIDLIRKRSAGTRSPELLLGIGDDCAILRPRPGEDIVVTTDFTLEGRHFRRDWHSPASAGHRTLARGLSDLAAMGARPVAAFLSLALPKLRASDPAWVTGFLDGLLRLAAEAVVPLAGGDTAQAPDDHVLADIVLLGAVPSGQALRRSGARPGDRLFCTGSLGGAAAELALLQQFAADGNQSHAGSAAARTSLEFGEQLPDAEAHPQLFPRPRLHAGQALRKGCLATAAMDLSDGLSSDLHQLCRASHVAAEVRLDRLPLHPFTHSLPPSEALALALHGGEDYELLFTASPECQLPSTLAGLAITEIGRIVNLQPGQPRVRAIDAQGHSKVIEPGGWEHLR